MQNLNDMLNNNSNNNNNITTVVNNIISSCSNMSNNHNNDFKEQISFSNYSEVNHVKQLSTDIGNLFDNTDYCDVGLIVEGVEFRAHKIILAARSEYFRYFLKKEKKVF
jgi:hypothetical protein